MTGAVVQHEAGLVDLGRERARRGLSNEPWVSKQELAAHFGTSPRSVERWLNDPWYRRGGRQAPGRRIFGGPVMFQIGVVQAWLDEPHTPERVR